MGAPTDLELDLDVFTGPFDLLLALVLREEVDLLEVPLADVVISYLDLLEARGELDLDAATEFLVLVASLLELKSRLMLPQAEAELIDAEPGEAAEELLARMLEARRFRSAAAHLRDRLEAEEGLRYRSAAPPPWLRRGVEIPEGAYRPDRLGRALTGLLREPPKVDLSHVTLAKVTVAERLGVLRGLLRRGGTCSFDDAVRGADRVTVAVTLWALLELHRRGEATWEQDEPFGAIAVRTSAAATARASAPARPAIEAVA